MCVFCSIGDFAQQQVDVAKRLLVQHHGETRIAISESDTIEKLIVPVLVRLYGPDIEIIRAGRDARSETHRRWDLMLQYPHRDGVWQAVVECKSICHDFHVKRDGGQRWRIDENTIKIVNGDVPSLDSGSDMLLQVLLYLKSKKFLSIDKDTRVLWSNGRKWIVFHDRFRRGEHAELSRLTFSDKGGGIDLPDSHYSVVDFGNDKSSWVSGFERLKQLVM